MVKHDWSVEDYGEYRREVTRRCQKLRREIAKGNGLCTICCKNEARKHMATCYECSTRIANRNRARRQAQKEQADD